MKKDYFKIALLSIGLLGSGISFAQTKQDVEKILRSTNVKVLNEFKQELRLKNKKSKKRALELAKINGWEIKGKDKDGRIFELMSVTNDGQPIYYNTYNATAAVSTRANHLNSGGSLGLNLDGQGMTAYVWDGGHARTTHVEYKESSEYGVPESSVSIADGSPNYMEHSGHVMGTMIAKGVDPSAKGMAPKAKGKSYDWNSDGVEAISAATNGMLISNHSYGYNPLLLSDNVFGCYDESSQSWDKIMYNAPYYLMVVAAGNDGEVNLYNDKPLDGESNYDKLTGHGNSKNNLVVANFHDAQINWEGNLISANRNASSSEGPTDDYRIKPDIAANGSDVYSTGVSNNNNYVTHTGTSMASPNAAGTLLLVQQHYKNLTNNFMKSATLKGLALHTADDVEVNGPDATSGWGLLNAKTAVQTISNRESSSSMRELNLENNKKYTFTVNAVQQDLKVSICWTDIQGEVNTNLNSHNPVLVNDLDLRVIKNGQEFLPWKLTGVTTNEKGDNFVDPFERIDVSNANGQYEITVVHKGTLSKGSQNFSIIVTGGTIQGDGVVSENTDIVPSPNPIDGNPGNNNPVNPPSDCDGELMHINIETGAFASEISWDVKNSNGQIVVKGKSYENDYSKFFESADCMTYGCYTFTINDSFGDGFNGGGYITMTVNGEQKVNVSGNFGSSKSINFCINNNNPEPIPTPTPPVSCISSKIKIKTGWSKLLKWRIKNSSTNEIVASGDGYSWHTSKVKEECLTPGCYIFEAEQLRWKSNIKLDVNNSIVVNEWGKIGGRSITKEFCIKSTNQVNSDLVVNEKLMSQVKIYPNPVTSNYVNLKVDAIENGSYQIFNIFGAKVLEGNFNEKEIKINISRLESGLYMVNVFNNSKSIFTDKLLIK